MDDLFPSRWLNLSQLEDVIVAYPFDDDLAFHRQLAPFLTSNPETLSELWVDSVHNDDYGDTVAVFTRFKSLRLLMIQPTTPPHAEKDDYPLGDFELLANFPPLHSLVLYNDKHDFEEPLTHSHAKLETLVLDDVPVVEDFRSPQLRQKV